MFTLELINKILTTDYPNIKKVVAYDTVKHNTIEELYSVLSRVIYTDGSFGKITNIFNSKGERMY